ncbi:hypothetical protein J4G08_02810 [Candidatus Poribacteria bacterium]|nr:hypothetical protein [Candidatus Poribacteria bacterium]
MSITKQRLLCGVIPVLLLILAVSPVCFAEGEVNAMPHLRLGAGARSIGLGGAFTAIAEDATATVWNPAGLGSAADLSLNFSTQRLSLDRSHNFIALTKALGTYGSIGLAATNFGVSDYDLYDAQGEYGGKSDYSSNAYSLSYGIAVGHFNIGLTGRMLMDNFGVDSVENQSGFGGVDIGIMGHALHIDIAEKMMGQALHAHSNEAHEGHIQVPTFHYGIVAKYLGASLGEGTVPMVVDVGVAYDLYMGNVVTFSADIEQEFVNLDESAFSMRSGVEYTIFTNRSTEFSLRAGIRASRDVQNLFGGFGVNIAGLQLDYAIQDGMAREINGAGSNHYVSVSYEF